MHALSFAQQDKNRRDLLKAQKEFDALCEHIGKNTSIDINETEQEKQARLKQLHKLNAEGFEAFCRHYFPHYMTAGFAWFHLAAIKTMLKSPNKITVAEWPRGHAKSVFFNVFVPLWLKATNQLTGMILVGETEEKACTLLGDLQAELQANHRYTHDYGEQHVKGSWGEGNFSTPDGLGFWAFGISQNPAGTRKGAKRPNYIVVDDADSRKRAKNQQLTMEATEWVRGELLGCVTGNDRWNLIVANNRVAKNGLVAHLVGDVNDGDKPSDKINHIKAYAFEDPKTHKMLMPEAGGLPAWPGFYTTQKLTELMASMDYRSMLRNYFHTDLQDGNIFRREHLEFIKPLKPHTYDRLISYCDPSFKDNKTSDFKAIVLVGTIGSQYHVLDMWVRVATVQAMIEAHYDIHARWEHCAIHYMEANMLQDLIYSEYMAYSPVKGYPLPIRPDKRAKPNKEQRIEGISGLFERGLIKFNEALQNTADYGAFLNQLLAFPNGNHDDGPDALEGAVHMLQKRIGTGNNTIRSGSYNRNKKRTAL